MYTSHGDDIYPHPSLKANFSSNISPYGVHPQIWEHIRNSLELLNNHPPPGTQIGKIPSTLCEIASKYHGLPKEYFFFTNGSVEALHILGFLLQHRISTIPIPSFAEYEEISKSYNMVENFLGYHDQILKQENGVLFLGYPNNPDGKSFSQSQIFEYAKSFPQTLLIVDEAYIDFAPHLQTCIPGIPAFPNLIILRSLGKSFALPGLRMGYVIASPSVIARMTKHAPSWNLNSLAYATASYIFTHYEDMLPNISALLDESKSLQKAIHAIPGYRVSESPLHYFLVSLKKKESAQTLKTYLLKEHNLLIRDASTFRGLGSEYFRISTQTPQKNQQLLKALQAWEEKRATR
ncbi:MAG: histidinol-phosphate transaminase [Cytophagales bacterium]|nr:histidinol-phosphate transaminase [Cytophagales bacterium]